MRLIIILLIIACIFQCELNAQKALVVVPVADLLGAESGKDIYYKLSLCSKPVTLCPRIHQLLFNEIVTIQEETKAEAKIQINSVFYEITPNGTPQTTYWTLKKNLLPLRDLEQHNVSLQTIPKPLNFHKKKQSCAQEVISLNQPHFDPVTNKTYSAGTRFVRTESSPTSTDLEVFAFDPQKKTLMKILLPSRKCVCATNLSWVKRKDLFLHLLRSWAHLNNGYIPYVWGGCSFTQIAKEPHFLSISAENGGTLFQSPTPKYPCSGLDCAGLVVRAAQLAGIPYYLKNTATIANHLKEITNAKEIQAGDLIWFPGHVMIISDTHKNSIIEARAYGQGYGKIHELPLASVFKNIENLDMLIAHAQQKKPIHRLQKDGSIAHAISNLKVLQLSSIIKH